MSTFVLPSFITVPRTSFLMGTPESDLSRLAKAYGGTRESFREESPQHPVTVDAFALSQTPLSVACYELFVSAGGAVPAQFDLQRQHPEAPVVNITLHMAREFCTWLSTDQGMSYRLPTEAEWECAARGTDGRQFPWGDEYHLTFAATRESGVGLPAVGSYTEGVSPWGFLDMAGTVWEWTSSLDWSYPYTADDGRNDPMTAGRRVIRGGCYVNPHGYARCACRFRMAPEMTNPFLGFRVARSIT